MAVNSRYMQDTFFHISILIQCAWATCKYITDQLLFSMHTWLVLASEDQEALLFEFIWEFLQVPSLHTSCIVNKFIREVFSAFKRDRSQHRIGPRVHLRYQIASIGPHTDHGLIDLLLYQSCLLFAIFFFVIIRAIRWKVTNILKDEIIEGFLAKHHFGNICPVQAIDAIRAHDTLLVRDDGTFLGKHVSCLMIDSKIAQILPI